MFEIKIMDNHYNSFTFRSNLMAELTNLAAEMIAMDPKIHYELRIVDEKEVNE